MNAPALRPPHVDTDERVAPWGAPHARWLVHSPTRAGADVDPAAPVPCVRVRGVRQ